VWKRIGEAVAASHWFSPYMSIDNANSECFCNMPELQYNTPNIGLGMDGTAITGGYDKEWLFTVDAFISVG
jgi:hypothetical protein